MSLRLLTPSEMAILEHQGCCCAHWDKIKAEDPFIVSHYRNVAFAGDVVLHSAVGTVTDGSAVYEAGIYNAAVSDCEIGRGAHVSNIGNRIANCTVGAGAFVRNVSVIDCHPSSTHGAGVEVNVLSETGGREVPIYYGLTAQEAWVIAMCRHDMALVNRMKSAVALKAPCRRCGRSIIGDHAVITDCGHIDGVDIKSGATISGASRLVNGTVGENAVVGTDVIATDFILAKNSTVDTAARLDHVFVGEGSRIANGFSAHHSLIFANCILENGEAAAIFAGPYTVSMHKSTLLIGCMTSMFNAGSGANQSNHLYKTGPCHQGILERGVKLASDAYLMWPAHIGAFSMVMGRHKSHPDTSSLPFSYIVENGGVTQVIPAVALGNIGVARDIDKWPRRDRRPACPADAITFDLINPYIAQRIEEGITLLEGLIAGQPNADILTATGFTIKRTHALRALKLYDRALRHYIIGTMMRRIADGIPLEARAGIGCGQWIDVAGMVAPATLFANGMPELSGWDDTYRQLEWEWTASRLSEEPGLDLEALSPDIVTGLLDEWLHIDKRFTDMLLNDATKEFDTGDSAATAGFGLLGHGLQSDDFRNVRGTIDNHPVSALVKARTAETTKIIAAVKDIIYR